MTTDGRTYVRPSTSVCIELSRTKLCILGMTELVAGMGWYGRPTNTLSPTPYLCTRPLPRPLRIIELTDKAKYSQSVSHLHSAQEAATRRLLPACCMSKPCPGICAKAHSHCRMCQMGSMEKEILLLLLLFTNSTRLQNP